MLILSASGMHLKKRSSGAYKVKGAGIRGAADAVLGTDRRGQSRIYDTRSGTFLTIILLFILGWVPMFGQMVSGFAGGRRAGSPARGLIASFTGTFIVLLVMFLVVEILRGINSSLVTDPEGEIALIASSSPVLQQLLDASLGYCRELFGNPDFSIDYAMYAITIPFGLIGGIFADQSQKEARLIVARTGRANARRVRSMDAYKDGKTLGFESFEQCTSMSVNTMSMTVNRSPGRTVETHTAPVKKTTVRTKESPVSATVETTRVQSSPTSSAPVRSSKDSEAESTVYI